MASQIKHLIVCFRERGRERERRPRETERQRGVDTQVALDCYGIACVCAD
jgi:hypothetical protein